MSRTHHHGGFKGSWVKRPIGFRWFRSTPSFWTRYYMSRPRRQRDRLRLWQVVSGFIEADEATYSVGGRKPHVYFW